MPNRFSSARLLVVLTYLELNKRRVFFVARLERHRFPEVRLVPVRPELDASLRVGQSLAHFRELQEGRASVGVDGGEFASVSVACVGKPFGRSRQRKCFSSDRSSFDDAGQRTLECTPWKRPRYYLWVLTYCSDPSLSACFSALVYDAAAFKYSATRKFLLPSSFKACTSGDKPTTDIVMPWKVRSRWDMYRGATGVHCGWKRTFSTRRASSFAPPSHHRCQHTRKRQVGENLSRFSCPLAPAPLYYLLLRGKIFTRVPRKSQQPVLACERVDTVIPIAWRFGPRIARHETKASHVHSVSVYACVRAKYEDRK